jgi:hypothetical protein
MYYPGKNRASLLAAAATRWRLAAARSNSSGYAGTVKFEHQKLDFHGKIAA